MKKNVFLYLLIVMMLVSLTACAGKDTDTGKKQIESMKILPSRMEQISQGGVIPEGCEAAVTEEGAYPLESLWGRWVPETETIETEQTITVQTVASYDEETGERGDTTDIELKVFPAEMDFRPPWMGLDDLMDYFVTKPYSWSWDMEEVDSEYYEYTAMGNALKKIGGGYGNIEYEDVEQELDAQDAASLADSISKSFMRIMGGSYNVAYKICENTLAIGLLSCDLTLEKNPEEFDITEIDYGISFEGWKLTLTYGDESVTYIPENFNPNNVIELSSAGIEDGYETMEGILGITNEDGKQQVMYDYHEGYMDAGFDFQEDGTVEISVPNSEKYILSYLASEKCLTLISDEKTSIYSSYREAKESGNVSAGEKGVTRIRLSTEYSPACIVVDQEIISFSAASPFQKLLDAGFETNISLDQTMKSCVVSDEIVMQKNGINIVVKVVNPWESPVALSECKICYVYLNDRTGSISTDDESVIGSTSYDTMERFYEAPYEKTETMLKYKVYSSADQLTSLWNWDKESPDYGEELLDINSTDMELIYNFTDGILSSYEIQCPELFYNGLQDNVDSTELAAMSPAVMSGVVEIRDTVLDRLKKAFEEAGISVNIDESTGEIVMDSTILFETESSSLSEKGKKYIDSFMGVYASVILDDSLKDVISEVRFEGHTDSRGTYEYNLELSQDRADAVLEYCLSDQNKAMDSGQKASLKKIAKTIGYSYADLVYTEKGEEDQDASRRVAVKFYVDPSMEMADEGKTGSGGEDKETEDISKKKGNASELTEADFTVEGRKGTIDLVEYSREKNEGSTWHCYEDGTPESERIFEKTYREIHLGDSLKQVLEAYGESSVQLFDEDEDPFYDESDFTREMKDVCSTFVMYTYTPEEADDEDFNAILIYFDDRNCVSWIVYYVYTW